MMIEAATRIVNGSIARRLRLLAVRPEASILTDELRFLADNLAQKETVLLNLPRLWRDMARRARELGREEAAEVYEGAASIVSEVLDPQA